MSAEFREEALLWKIKLSISAPKHQEMNGLCKQTWQALRNIAFATMNHARVGEAFTSLALIHATYIYHIPPIKGLTLDNHPTTPFRALFGKDASI